MTEATPETNSTPGCSATPVRYPRGLIIFFGVLIFIAVGSVALIWLPALLLDHWVPGLAPESRGRLLGGTAQIVLLALGGIIAIVGVGLSLARHGEQLRAAARDDEQARFERDKERTRQEEFALSTAAESERTLRERFVRVVEMLRAGDSATTRIAGVYALAHLADDWIARGNPADAQVCIEVLCSYLRAPLPDGTTATPPAECAVKRTGFAVIRAHLRGNTPSWEGHSIDLNGALIDFDVDLSDIRIGTEAALILRGATITGSAIVDLQRLRVEGAATLDVRQVSLTGDATLNLNDAHVTTSAAVGIEGMTVSGRGSLQLVTALFDGTGRVDGVTFTATDDSTLFFTGTTLSNRFSVSLSSVVMKDRARAWARDVTITDHASVSVYGTTISPDAIIYAEGYQTTGAGSFRLGGGDA